MSKKLGCLGAGTGEICIASFLFVWVLWLFA